MAKTKKDTIKKIAHSAGDEKFIRAHLSGRNNVRRDNDKPTELGLSHDAHIEPYDRSSGHMGYNPGDDDARYDSVNEGLRHNKTYTLGNRTAKVYRDTEWEEWRVQHYLDGKHQIKADYHTPEKDDAHNTAASWVSGRTGKEVMHENFISTAFNKWRLSRTQKKIDRNSINQQRTAESGNEVNRQLDMRGHNMGAWKRSGLEANRDNAQKRGDNLRVQGLDLMRKRDDLKQKLGIKDPEPKPASMLGNMTNSGSDSRPLPRPTLAGRIRRNQATLDKNPPPRSLDGKKAVGASKPVGATPSVSTDSPQARTQRTKMLTGGHMFKTSKTPKLAPANVQEQIDSDGPAHKFRISDVLSSIADNLKKMRKTKHGARIEPRFDSSKSPSSAPKEPSLNFGSHKPAPSQSRPRLADRVRAGKATIEKEYPKSLPKKQPSGPAIEPINTFKTGKTKKIHVPKADNINESHWDGMSHAARELIMHADNHAQLHMTSHNPILANLTKKKKKGIYDPKLATKLWGYHADRAAKSYHALYGDKRTKWHELFPTTARKQAAEHWEMMNRDSLDESYILESVINYLKRG